MGDINEIYALFEEDNARRLLRRQLVSWIEDVKLLITKLQLHADPEVKATAYELQRYIVRRVIGN